MRFGAFWMAGVLLIGGCGGATVTPQGAADLVMISVVGTNDSHGQLERVAVLSGYLQNLRAAREADGGAVVLEQMMESSSSVQEYVEEKRRQSRPTLW